MSSRRNLVSRARRDEIATPSSAQRRPRDSGASSRQPTPLPPYEPPSCPLTASAKRALEGLAAKHDDTKYKNHLKLAIQNVIHSAVEPSDRLYARQRQVKQQIEKRQKRGKENEEKTDLELETEEYAEDLERKVLPLTAKAEKALRELIDFSDELAMRDTLLNQVNEKIPYPSAQPSAEVRLRQRRARNGDSDGEAENEDMDVDEEAPASDPTILSAVEILNDLKQDYHVSYTSRTMRARYANNNDYVGFKRNVHDAFHPGPDAPPVPRANTWFPQEAGDAPDNAAARRRRRLANATDNINNEDEDEDEDEDVIIAGITTSLKCPMTLKLMEHPLSNRVCKHSYEKKAILEYLRDSGTVFAAEPRRRGQQSRGTKKVTCPQSGCQAMLSAEDFYEDQLLIRQCKRAAKEEAGDFEEDDDDAENYGRGTQRNAEEIDDDGGNTQTDENPQQAAMRVKRERLSSMVPSGLGYVSSPEPNEDEIEAMESPEADEDEIDAMDMD